jgi:hypothetical protein
MPRFMRRIGVGAMLLGCTRSEISNAGVNVTDSAGVVIVTHRGPRLDTTLLQVDGNPGIRIGGDSTDPRYALEGARNAVRLSDGRIVVAIGRTQELRFFDSLGQFTKAVGRKGRGPGEFDHLVSVYRGKSDSLYAYDNSLMRITVFDSAGGVVRVIPLSPFQRRLPEPALGRFANGGWLMAVTERDSRVATHKQRVTFRTGVVRYDNQGRPLRNVGWLAVDRVFIVSSPKGGGAFHDVPFAPRSQLTVRGDSYYLADGREYRIEVRDTTGGLMRVVRRAESAARLTQQDIEAFRKRELEQATDEESRRMVTMWLDATPYPDAIPALARLEVDGADRLWVQRFSAELGTDAPWDVYDSSGRSLGSVTLPRGLNVTDIGSDFVLGIRQDETGVHRIELYRLRDQTR